MPSTSNAASGCVGYAVVSEAGASVYSASDRAREEFPPEVLDISYVGAVSIGRRLVDPLSELIKVQVILLLFLREYFLDAIRFCVRILCTEWHFQC